MKVVPPPPQCFYLDSRGRRCPQPAGEDSPFCAAHDPEGSSADFWEGWGWRRMLLRLLALVLLLIFVAPLVLQGYRMLKGWLN